MSRERLVCVDPRTKYRILGQKLAFLRKFRRVWYQKKAQKPGLPSLLRAGKRGDYCPFSQRSNPPWFTTNTVKIRFRIPLLCYTTLPSAQEIGEDFLMWSELLHGGNVAR